MNTVVAVSLRDPELQGSASAKGAVLSTTAKTVTVERQLYHLDHVFTTGGTNEVRRPLLASCQAIAGNNRRTPRQ